MRPGAASPQGDTDLAHRGQILPARRASLTLAHRVSGGYAAKQKGEPRRGDTRLSPRHPPSVTFL
jgi:hypothetical protein